MNNLPPFLDDENIARINRLSGQQIVELEARHLKELTHDFDEEDARMIVLKGSTPSEQKELLDALRSAFDSIYAVDYWNGEAQYNVEVPSYFDEWDFKIAVDGGISKETPIQPDEVTPTPAPTLTEMLSEEGHLTTWLNLITKDLLDSQKKTKDDADSIISQVKALRDGSLTRLQKKLEEIQKENDALKKELDKLRHWREEWSELRNSVVREYDESIISEIGGVDDEDLMREMVEAVAAQRQREMELQEENERLRQNQDKWRESEEYKSEKEKWESAKKQSIKVEELKRKLLDYVGTYMGSGENLTNFVLILNQILKSTAWEMAAENILKEVKDAYQSANQNPSTINAEKIEIEQLSAQQVNEIRENEIVNLGGNGNKG